MIKGEVSDDGVPLIELEISGQAWIAMIDSGFNGDLELPIQLRPTLQGQFVGRVKSSLAAGQEIEEDVFLVQIPFDGQLVKAQATYASVSSILIGTRLMKRHRLTINFPQKSVLLKRV